MKVKKCPARKHCFDYRENNCDNCEFGNEFTKLHKRIERLKEQNETLTIQRNAWALTAKVLGNQWISVEERLPTEDEYLTHHNDGLDSLKRLTVAYMTDTIEYTIGCYDGYKWMNQLGNKKINDVVAWKPFELYEAPMMKGGAE